MGRAGKRSLLVTKELAFQKGGGDCRTVDGPEGMTSERAMIMDRPGDQFLSCSRLSFNENGYPVLAENADGLEDLLHRFALADDLPFLVRLCLVNRYYVLCSGPEIW